MATGSLTTPMVLSTLVVGKTTNGMVQVSSQARNKSSRESLIMVKFVKRGKSIMGRVQYMKASSKTV